jgi:hypothetical protein
MRRAALILAVVFGLLILFYGAVWLWAWSRLGSQIDQAIADHEAAGGEFAASELSVGGFPFSLGASADDFVLTQPDGTVWRSAKLSGWTSLWSLDRIRLQAEDGLDVSVPAAGAIEPMTAQAVRAGGTIDHDFGRTAPVLHLRFDHFEADPPGGPAARADWLELTVVGADPQAEPGAEELSVAVDAENLLLPQAAPVGLGSEIAEVGLGVTLVGPPPPGFFESALARWRAAGGLVRFDRLHLVWGELGLEGEGTVELDEALQPLVRLDTRVRGLNQTLAALTRAGTLSVGQAAAIGLGFGMLGGQAGEDGTPLTIEIADRRVSVGSAVLPGRLPPVEWPEDPAPRPIN